MGVRESGPSLVRNLKADVLTDWLWGVRWAEDPMAPSRAPSTEEEVGGLPKHRRQVLGDGGRERLQSCGTSGRRHCVGC